MGGFATWLTLCGHPGFDPKSLTLFDVREAAKLPSLRELDSLLRKDAWPEDGADGGINGAFMSFMRGEAYDYVDPIEGAIGGIKELQEHYDVRFCTALMKAAPEHVPSKMRWLERYFPGVPYFTAPSTLKMEIKGDIGIDDRYDTCARWETVGTKSFLFKQPWNEAPIVNTPSSYNWTWLTQAIRKHG